MDSLILATAFIPMCGYLVLCICIMRRVNSCYDELLEVLSEKSASDLEQIDWPMENHFHQGEYQQKQHRIKLRVLLWGLPPQPWISNSNHQLANRFRKQFFVLGAILFVPGFAALANASYFLAICQTGLFVFLIARDASPWKLASGAEE